MREVMHRLHDELEDRHWWFAARRRIVLDQLDRALSGSGRRPAILDIGCGAGGMLRELARRGEARGLEADTGALQAARARSGCEVRPGRLPEDVPFDAGSFDVVTLLDVLEHIDDDAGALAAIVRLLRPGGLLLCTVPAYRFLWSLHDVLNEHRRRYTRSQLRRCLETAGLRVRKITYYNTLLFPPIAAARLLRGSRGGCGKPDLGAVPAPLDAVLRAIFGAERFWLRRAAFPFGVSVLALARKPGDSP